MRSVDRRQQASGLQFSPATLVAPQPRFVTHRCPNRGGSPGRVDWRDLPHTGSSRGVDQRRRKSVIHGHVRELLALGSHPVADRAKGKSLGLQTTHAGDCYLLLRYRDQIASLLPSTERNRGVEEPPSPAGTDRLSFHACDPLPRPVTFSLGTGRQDDEDEREKDGQEVKVLRAKALR